MTDKKTPKNYIHWVFTDHYFNNKQGIGKFMGTIMFICFAVYMPGPVLEEYWGGWIPIWPVIGCFIAVYGGLIGILWQPYNIYKKLKRMNWWEREDPNRF
jgi:hypothetical protein|tara:strand:+ start:155 stop:454 length:300 start_codon:yes stop_codon:yes gene_type:complete